MHRYLNYLTILLLILLTSMAANAQDNDDPRLAVLDSTLIRYAGTLEQPDLYLHVDKTVYVPNENIWFAGYLLNQDLKEAQHTLYVMLVEEATQKICLQERFAINNGLTAGSLFIPDSLTEGEYRLLAYPNGYLLHPQQAVYQQAISLRKNITAAFRLTQQPLQPDNVTHDSVRFSYKVLTVYSGLASNGNITYQLKVDGRPLQSGKMKVNAFGEINFTVPKEKIMGKRLRLFATVTRDKDKQDIQTDVQLFERTAFLKCFPEGGNLVDDHPTKMGIELRNGMGAPVATQGALLEDGQEIARFNTDAYGMAILQWQPHQGRNYTFKMADTSWLLSYTVPPIAIKGYSLSIPHPVVRDSSLYLEMRAPDTGACYLVLHNYRQSFFTGKLKLVNLHSSLHLPLSGVPDGVATLTLFNAQGVPQVERCIYIQQQQPLQVQLTTDSVLYQHRSKLNLNIKVTDEDGKPVQSLFSLACVLGTRIDSNRAGDIARYYYFDRFLPQQTALPSPEYFTHTEQVERILLVCYWTRYKWEVMDTTQIWLPDTDKTCDAGYVTRNGKKIRKPVELMILGERTFTLQTDSSGYFLLPAQAQRVNDGKKVIVMVTDKKHFQEYGITMLNLCSVADTALAASSYVPVPVQKAELTVEEQRYLEKAMKAVVVTARKRYDYGVFHSTTCNDWVCMYNILNCRNHPMGIPPVDGQTYTYNGQQVVYKGCKGGPAAPEFMTQLKGVNYPREFYVADYEKFNPEQPEISTTVLWRFNGFTDANGETTIKFSTNDLNGRFICVLQGYSTQGPVSGKTTFTVKGL